MRIFMLSPILALLAAPAAAQSPLTTLAPPPGPVLGPRTVVPATMACAGMPATAAPSTPLRILAPHMGDRHELVYRDDIVVLSAGTPQGLQPGQRFFTRRYEPPVTREVSDTNPGSIRTSGWLTVIAADEHSALARVDYACAPVASGDYLEPYTEPSLPTAMAAGGSTDFSQLGRVLFGTDRRESFGAGDVLSIDRGAAAGMAPGMRVAFYRDRQNGTPLVEIGAGVVLEVAPSSSKVVLERARLPVERGDFFGIRLP